MPKAQQKGGWGVGGEWGLQQRMHMSVVCMRASVCGVCVGREAENVNSICNNDANVTITLLKLHFKRLFSSLRLR